MATWPKTIRGNLVAVLLAFIVLMTAVQLAIGLSGPTAWLALTVISLTASVVLVVLFFRHRRTAAAYDLAMVDAPSFSDVLPHWNRHDDPEPPVR